jgi:hypothetical protein
LVVDDALNFYTDISDCQIAKYSPEGKELFKIAREGEGPGDIKRLGWFAINPKDSMLYVTEMAGGNKRISVFSPEDGHFVRLWPSRLEWKNWDGISHIQCDNQGNVYVEAVKSHWRRHKTFSIGALEKVIIKFDSQGKLVKELYRMQSDFMADQGGKGNITIPYSNYLYWRVHGRYLFVRENHSRYIDVFLLNGKPVKKILLPFPRDEISREDLEKWEKRLISNPVIKQGIQEGWFDLKFWKKNLPFPKYKWVSGGQMFWGSGGELYSQKAAGYGNENENTWAVITPGSWKVEVYRFPLKHRLRCIKDHSFFFTVQETEGEEVLRIIDKEMVIKK